MKQDTFWLVTGSQELYGPEPLERMAEHSRVIAEHLNKSTLIPFKVEHKPVLTTPDAIYRVLTDANVDDACAGVITWMHTFSPGKMWIRGLASLRKPLLHFHTQFNRDIPWDSIDMNFMNVNQSAHGDREFGFLGARMKVARKVIVGHWGDEDVQNRISAWMHTAVAYAQSGSLKVARFGDNMREVAVTEGDKLEAQIKLGWSVSGFGVGDLVERIGAVSDAEVRLLLDEYAERYDFSSVLRNDERQWSSVRGQARIELGLRSFLQDGDFHAFTTTFEDLHGVEQVPGLAVQRLMELGYGFGAEGDWKAAALLYIMKVIAGNQGTSFMEDYTYHLEPGNEMVLGAHMLEVCPTIAGNRPRIEVHPLSIGGKAAPARLVFDGQSGPAVCASLVDLGNRFRLVVNEVDAIQPERDMPKLPVARVLWKPLPSLLEAAEAWIYAGGPHHTAFSYNVTAEQLADYADMAGVECVVINRNTSLLALRNDLRLGDVFWRFQ